MFWFTSDLHLGHANIIKFCDRPFKDVNHMNQALIDNWNSLVCPDDIVWVLGDVAMGDLNKTLPMASRLVGHKHLVTGNHDKCWAGHGRPGYRVEEYKAAGFESINHGSWWFNVQDGPSIQMNHFPFVGDKYDGDRFEEWRPKDDGRWLLHGHVHEKWKVKNRMINVGVDVWDYAPVALRDILWIIEKGEG